jgi:uncharacterized damage-inducible protein DinB
MNTAQFFDHWNTVHRDLLRAVSMLEDEDLAFRPAEKYPRTVGDILRHIINVQRGWIQYVIDRSIPEWPEEELDRLNTVDLIRDELNSVFHQSMNFLATIPVEDLNRVVQIPGDGVPKLSWILWHVFEQQIHHRGELFLCLSLLGKNRPKIDRPG